jgi:hypothetical protein
MPPNMQSKMKLAAAIALLPVLASAGEQEQLRQQRSDGLADCAAYYAVSAQQPGVAADAGTALRRRSLALVKNASRFTNQKIAIQRYRETLQTLQNELAAKSIGMEELDARYRNTCGGGG